MRKTKAQQLLLITEECLEIKKTAKQTATKLDI